MKKRHWMIKSSTKNERITKKEMFEEKERKFVNELSALKFINKEIAKIIKNELPKMKQNKADEVLKKMTKEDKKELKRWEKWCEGPIEKQRQFSTRSKLVAKYFGENVTMFIHEMRFSYFLKEMSLVYLITEFEEFLKGVITTAILIQPNILKKSEKTIGFQEILSTKDREKLVEKMIEKEVKSLIKGDIDEISHYFKKQFKMELTSQKDTVQFKERFYRRHILIHNGLSTDKRYREKSGYKGKDQRHSITENYLKRSITLYQNAAKHVTKQMISKFAA